MMEFGSVDEAFDWMKRMEQRANSRIHPIQHEVKRGGYAIRPYHEFHIFGYVKTTEEIAEDELKCGADAVELNYTMQTLAESYLRGYRHGMWYSPVCPEGELGDAHISNLIPITKEDFELARASKWEIDPDQHMAILVNSFATFKPKDEPA